jgi:tRNA-splicing endonuclease subunit Sen54
MDDDDLPTSVKTESGARPDIGAAADESGGGPATAEDVLEDETQDFQLFATMFRKGKLSAQSIRKGEKDFEAHGTRAQDNALERSRGAMEDALSYTRVHKQKNWIRGWFFPDLWEDWPQEDGDGYDFGAEGDGREMQQEESRRWPEAARDRVVVVEAAGAAMSSVGRAIANQPKDRPARGKDWLLPEEALFLIERGSLDLWWPLRGLEEIFPTRLESDGNNPDALIGGAQGNDTEFEMGIPLSLEAAYSLLIGNEGERGKISLQKYQVYSNLRRGGYNILRAPSSRKSWEAPKTTLWEWVNSRLWSQSGARPPAYGPLVQPGLYRSYNSIFHHLAVIPRHKPSPQPTSSNETHSPFEIHFCVWKSSTAWTKTRPPSPDFFMVVVDAQDSSTPTLGEIAALLDCTPWAPPKPEWAGPGRLYARLKHGYRNVLVAVNDHGVINYMRFSESAFGEETLYNRFDKKGGASRGGKKGGGKNASRGGRHRQGNGKKP